MPITDLFSKRGKPLPDVFVYDTFPEKLRAQLVHVLRSTLVKAAEYSEPAQKLATRIRFALLSEHGIFSLCSVKQHTDAADIANCLLESEDLMLLLDVVELALKSMAEPQWQFLWKKFECPTITQMIKEVNHRFRENGVGYHFDYHALKIIRVDSILIHESAIKPVLQLLSEPQFTAANAEFLQAFDDYKKGDWSDCVVKSCAAFESVLKIICDSKKWPYSPNDPCSKLVESVVSNGGLEPFLTEPLKMIGSVRNKKSIAHGAGTAVKDVSESLARYCLNMTASSILYVVESTR